VYKKPDVQLSSELEIVMLEEIKNSFREWRRVPCSFRGDVSSRLRFLLEELEEAKLNGRRGETRDLIAYLASVTRGRRIFGFPLHVIYTNTEDVIERIRQTDIHRSKVPGIEFALAVRIFPYESNVLSVWVFICTLSPDSYPAD